MAYHMEGHAEKCVEDIANLRIKQLSNFSKSRRPAWMIINSKKKKMDQLENYLLFASKLSWNVLFGAYWWPDIFEVCEQICSCGNEMDKSMRQTLSAFDLLHWSHMWIHAILLFGKHSTTLHIRIVSRFWFRRRPWRLELNISRNSMHFQKSNVRANKLDVQETHFCFTRFYSSWGDFSRCRFYAWMGFPLTNTNLDLNKIDHVPSSGTHAGSNAMLYVFEDIEAVIKMRIKGRSPTLRQVSRTHSCVGLVVWQN